jgi:hypothetical protein
VAAKAGELAKWPWIAVAQDALKSARDLQWRFPSIWRSAGPGKRWRYLTRFRRSVSACVHPIREML